MYLQVVGAGDDAALVLRPVQAEDGLLMEIVDLVNGQNLLQFVSFVQLLDVENLQDGGICADGKMVASLRELTGPDGLVVSDDCQFGDDLDQIDILFLWWKFLLEGEMLAVDLAFVVVDNTVGLFQILNILLDVLGELFVEVMISHEIAILGLFDFGLD